VAGNSTLCKGIRLNNLEFGCTDDCSPYNIHVICINLDRRIFVSYPERLLKILKDITKIFV